MNRRALRQQLGSRSARRKGTKLHTQKLARVKGAAREGAKKRRPSVASRMKALIRKEADQ